MSEKKLPDTHSLTKKLVSLRNDDSRDMVVESTLNKIPDEYLEELPYVQSFTDINNLFYSDYHALLEGKTGCLSGDTRIKLGKNIHISLHQLYKQQLGNPFNLFSVNLKKTIVESDTAVIIDSGVKPLCRIRTKSGKIVKASVDQTFFVRRNGIIQEIHVKNLRIGDKLIVEGT